MSVTPLVASECPTNENADETPIAASLEKIPLFQELPAAVLSQLEESSDLRRYSAGQTVYSMGQYDSGEFFVVARGVLRVSVLDGKTGAMQIENLGPQSVFGLDAALAESPPEELQRLAVNADDDVELIAIDSGAFRELAAGRPTLMRKIATHFAAQLSALRFKAMSVEASSEQRVYASLIAHVNRDPISGAWRIEKMPKHRELADQAGVEEAAAAGAVASLIQEGIARRDYPGLEICDFDRLKKLAQ